MTRAQEADAWLAGLYEQVPTVSCKGLCDDTCGPIGMGHREWARIARAGVRLPSRAVADEAARRLWARGENYQCPALIDGRCSVYDQRPMVCRIWGVSEGLECPYGCADDVDVLTYPYAQWLLQEANTAGMPLAPRKGVDWFHQFFADNPEADAYIEANRPTRTREES